jgi:hypothetical protein
VTLQNWANFIANWEETTNSIVRLQNTKLEDKLSRKGGGNVTVLGSSTFMSRGHVH